MCERETGFVVDTSLTRRGLMVGLSAAAMVGPGAVADAAALPTVEREVTVKTADGMADAALFHPAGKGRWPAVLMWPDILGLRPAFREMARRLAGAGYVVLVPNPFYRTKRAPVVTGPFDFGDRAAVAALFKLKEPLTDARVDADARAFVDFLDRQRATNRARPAAVQGYCFSGPFAFRTAAALPGRVRAVASFHGGGLVTKDANSPHLSIPATRADFLVAIARNDDAKQPEAKDVLRAAFAKAGRPARVEVFPAEHGWCVIGSQAYDEPAAERAWGELLQLYRTALA
jgi:carboxymethylenebutenolidase